MKTPTNNTIPPDLREADETMVRYGRWAQDRYQKQHCASVEHKYRPPKQWEEEEKQEPFIPAFKAMEVQHALVKVPMQYRRVMQAHYIPQRLPPEALRRMYRLSPRTWDASNLLGLRMFWNIYRLHYLKINA